jgi:ABC-2 type transport system ATP-binding protein
MISVQNLTRCYGPVVAVDDFSVEIDRGEIVGLLGHNGAGKTTVMKVLTGFLEPSAGSVSVGGMDVEVDRAGVQRQIGYMPENAPLYPEMLVQEYLCMMAELRAIPGPEVERAVAAAAAAVGVDRHLTKLIGTLSKGYRQRVGLAQALVHRPEVLVLDEPTNGLDPVQIQTIRELIVKLSARATIILSTHILQEIEAVCDRALIMIEGSLVADAPLSELLASRVVRLALLPGGEGVETRLRGIAGVRSVERRSAGSAGDVAGRDLDVWSVSCEEGAAPVSDIIEVAREAGWTIAGVAPERRTLESVFQELQERHAEQQRHAQAGAANAPLEAGPQPEAHP